MRKFFFVLLLIGAAFAGGAAVNGPGLRWAQAMVLQRLGSGADDGSSTTSGNGDNAANPDDPSQPLVTETPGTGSGIPAAPVAPLVVTAAKPVPAPKKETDGGAPSSAAAPPELPEPPAQPAPDSLKAALPTGSPTPEPLPPLTMAPAGQPLPPLEAPSDSTPAPTPTPKVTDNPAKDGDPAWGDAPGSAPAGAVPPKPFKDQARNPAERDAAVERVSAPADSPAAPSATASASGDWSALRRKMRDLGVSRYGFEGEPGGRVRFHCVIPLAGRRAVAQQFEAEGDDEFQAAQVALRRVALWRATEDPGR